MSRYIFPFILSSITKLVPEPHESRHHDGSHLQTPLLVFEVFVQETLNVLQRAFSFVVSAQVTGAERIFIVSFEAVELTDSFCSSAQVVLVTWTLGNLLHSPNSADCNLHQCASTIRLQRRPRRFYPS